MSLSRDFTCEMCKGYFSEARPEHELRKEAMLNFGEDFFERFKAHELIKVCDVCWKLLKEIDPDLKDLKDFTAGSPGQAF